MQKTHIFDVLVVYSGNIATSSGKQTAKNTGPFSLNSGRSEYNPAYAYLLETCEKNKLRSAFTTTSDIIAAGTCHNYWLYEQHTWKKVKQTAYASNIFDKFSPIGQINQTAHTTLYSAPQVTPFNNPSLSGLFFDKQLTYELLNDLAIPTVSVTDGSDDGINQALDKLFILVKNHPNQEDFGSEIIIKDRFGSGGNYIYKVADHYASNISAIMRAHNTISFVLQPFMHFEKGYKYRNREATTDIRLIYQNGAVIQTYIRTAKPNDFRCNVHQGGVTTYVKTNEIPLAVRKAATKITHLLKPRRSLYALDFIISNNGRVYFLEGNVNPGIYWDPLSTTEERMSKKMIRGIVTELNFRVRQTEAKPKVINPRIHVIESGKFLNRVCGMRSRI